MNPLKALVAVCTSVLLASGLVLGGAIAATAIPNEETVLPADGVQSIEKSGSTWTITTAAPAWEIKYMEPGPQQIICGTNYNSPCSTIETFTAEGNCAYLQVDWGGQGGYNSSDPYVCQDDTTPTQKVYVCKYVGTPGENETLQTGNNPIEVSVNALGNDFPGTFPWEFADQQGRSVAIGWAPGSYTIDDCPSPQGPPQDPIEVIVSAPEASDPTCDTDGELVLPEQEFIDWDVMPGFNGPGTYTVTATTDDDHVISGQSEWTIEVLAKGTGLSCAEPEVVVPGTPEKNDVCGTSNDNYELPDGPDGIEYSLNGTNVVATLVSDQYAFGTMPPGWVDNDDGTAFYDISNEVWTNEPCGDTPPSKFDEETTESEPDCEAGTVAITTTYYQSDAVWDTQNESWTFGGFYQIDTKQDTRDVEAGECPVVIAPPEPYSVDVCGIDNDRIVYPLEDGAQSDDVFTYTESGTIPGTVVVSVEVADGYVIEEGAETEWEFTFTDVDCPSVPPEQEEFPPALALTGSSPLIPGLAGLLVVDLGVLLFAISLLQRRKHEQAEAMALTYRLLKTQ